MTLYQLYGQTEAVPAAFMGPYEWFGDVDGSEPLMAAGRVMPFAEVEIRDADNKPLPLGEEGEIAIRNEGQMIGLWGDPEATARRIVDGWVLTGDIGRLDRNGYLYISDRKDDLIISGGFNIWPLELERVIAEDSRVVEVAVFGVPHDRWGETPLALCVVNDLSSITEDEVVNICAERLGRYKKPGRVVFQTEPIPKSVVGKVQRKVLREPYWNGQGRRVAGS
jgi:acyl-CoA synthetase (AMP-forming)/AMP-acid ligase II